MKKMTNILLSIGLSIGLVTTNALLNSAQAEEVRVPIAQQGSNNIKVPKKGMSKAQVQKRYGQAQSSSPSVGQPPISKWTYKNFTVYFEYEHVIHSVIHAK